MSKHIIIAPHADDEIIGCYQLLYQKEVAEVVFPLGNTAAVDEAIFSSRIFGFKISKFDEGDVEGVRFLAQKAAKKAGFILLPDPNWDFHPRHQTIGNLGMHLMREYDIHNILFYSTNMNAPYIKEVKNPIAKRDALNASYTQKETLWQYDYRYFLFEGYVNYNPIKFE